MVASNATIAALKVSLGLDSAQYEKGLRDAGATMSRETAKQAKAADQLRSRLVSLKSSLDPVYAAQVRVGQQMREAQDLFKKGALSGAEYGRTMATLAANMKAVSSAGQVMAGSQGDAVRSTKALQQAGLGLSRQLTDIGVQFSQKGANPFTIFAQQLPQIADGFAVAKMQGLSFGTVMKDVGASVARFLVAWAPLIALGGAAAGAFFLWRKQIDDTREALKATADATKGFSEVQASTRDALVSAVEFTERYKVSNEGLTNALDGVISSQNAAYAQTLSGIDANDAAGRSALRRAELERLLTVSILKRAAAEAQGRAAEADAAAKKAKGPARTSGLVVAFGLAGDPLALQAAQEAEAAKFKKLGGDAAKDAAAKEREYAKALTASADALMNAKLTIPPATAAVRSHGAASKQAANDADDFARALQRVLDSLATPAERALKEMNENTLVLRRALAEGKISADEFREAIERMFPAVESLRDAQKAWRADLVKTPADIKPVEQHVKSLREAAESLARAFDDVSYSFGSIIGAFKSGDFSRLLVDVLNLKDGLGSLLSGGAGGVAAAGSALATAVGGRGGRTVGTALGIASTGLSAGAFAGSAAGAAALGTAGLGAGAIAGIAAFAAPIAIAAAALYAAVKIFNIGGKPTNAGAGYDLRNGQLSGDKRTSETEGAARSAGEAIQGIQDALKAAGIGITDAVTGLVIGTRDQTQIYLQSGRTLRSAVGDGTAAVDTALKALLEGATYVSEAQKKLVDGALAAGKGFDAIAEILSKYEAAQGIGKALADQIQQLTDPKAFDLEAVKRDIQSQRDAYKALASEGYITAEQLAGINAQLGTLEGLKLDEVLKRYSASLDSAANDNLQAAKDATGAALVEAYNAFASAKQAEIEALRQAADGLRAFRRELSFGALAGRNPTSQLQAISREFGRISALAPTDPDRLANLQGAGQAFVEASRAGARNELEFARNLAAVRRATEASELAATSQADVAQQQLDVQTAMLTQLGLLTVTNMDMATALKAYLAAAAAQKTWGTNDNLDVDAYLKANPDLGANWDAGGIMRTLGADLAAAARAQYATYGKGEIAKGLRQPGFATGGQFKVGGSGGIDSQLMQFWASPGEMVSVSHGDPQSNMASGVEGLRQEVQMLTGGVVQLSGFARRAEKFMKKWDTDGLPAERVV